MGFLLSLLVVVLSVWGSPRSVTAAPVGLAWDDTQTPFGFAVQRCQVGTGDTICIPNTDLPGMPLSGAARGYIDANVTMGSTYCWAVQAVFNATGSRSEYAKAVDHVTPYLCKQVAGVLPAPGPVTLLQVGTTLRLTWTAPRFDATTVPAGALDHYEIWIRADPSPPGPGWVHGVSVAKTVTTYDDLSPFAGGNCYQIRAQYGTLGYKENSQVCTVFTPVELKAPSNLREVPVAPVQAGAKHKAISKRQRVGTAR